MNSITVNARTIEEAINEGLSKLGCDISDCKVEILQEGAKGLFGFFGSKPASVRLTRNAEDEDSLPIDFSDALSGEPAPKPEHKPEPKPEKKPAPAPKPEPKPAPVPKPNGNRMRIAQNPQVIDKPIHADVVERFRTAPLPGASAPVKPEAPAPRPVQPKSVSRPRVREAELRREVVFEPVPTPENIVVHEADTPEGIAQRFLAEITRRMGVEVAIEVKTGEEGHLFVTMYGDTLGILIGRRGETLDALQYLTSLQVNRGRETYIRVTLDTERYRAKREEALSRLASRMASRAVKTGRKVALEPMNPYERRILHASLQGNPSVTTHSEGDEPYRHVVVVPNK